MMALRVSTVELLPPEAVHRSMIVEPISADASSAPSSSSNPGLFISRGTEFLSPLIRASFPPTGTITSGRMSPSRSSAMYIPDPRLSVTSIPLNSASATRGRPVSLRSQKGPPWMNRSRPLPSSAKGAPMRRSSFPSPSRSLRIILSMPEKPNVPFPANPHPSDVILVSNPTVSPNRTRISPPPGASGCSRKRSSSPLPSTSPWVMFPILMSSYRNAIRDSV